MGRSKKRVEIQPIVREEIQLPLFDPALRVTYRGQAYGNPLVMATLDGLSSAKSHLVYGRIGETTVVLQWAKKGTPGAVKVRRRKGERTALWSFGPVLALFPALKVEKGYVRRFPFRVEDGLFLIDVTQNDVVPSERAR